MSLSVPQNGVKADNEPVIELFVKVRPRSTSWSNLDKKPTSVLCHFVELKPFKIAIYVVVSLTVFFFYTFDRQKEELVSL